MKMGALSQLIVRCNKFKICNIEIALCLLCTSFSFHQLEAQTNNIDIKVYFSPHGGCTEAYSFKSEHIAEALIQAEKRGVGMEVILDNSQEQARGTEANFITQSGIPTYIDSAYRITHDKVMVIHNARVITGSFNFTKSAEDYNAKNLMGISTTHPRQSNMRRVGSKPGPIASLPPG